MQGPSDTRLGQLLGGKYALETLIARGGMGLVYGARHLGTGREVAVKLLRPELVTRRDLVRRVSAEARLAVEASHPNVVEVLDAGADDEGVPYVVLERLYGAPLEALLSSPLPLLATAQALAPISSALIRLHAAGIVHRDIKPANLFLSQGHDGCITPKLLDFGVAKALQTTGSTLSGVTLGTPAYMAPEQALGSRVAGAAADIWSLGVVLVRCLTGRLPFESRGDGFVGSLTAGLRLADLQGIPEPLAAVVIRALKFEPAERHASMIEFRAALMAAFHEIDSSRAWPSESTVSYAPAETELSLRLGSSGGAADEIEAGGPGLKRRPTQIETQTLRGHRKRRIRWSSLLASVAGVAGAAAAYLAIYGNPALPHGAQPPVLAEPSRGVAAHQGGEQGTPPMETPVAAREARPFTLQAAAPDAALKKAPPPPLDQGSSELERPRGPSARPPSPRTPAQRAEMAPAGPRTAEPEPPTNPVPLAPLRSEEADTETTAAVVPRLGANRSPIIE